MRWMLMDVCALKQAQWGASKESDLALLKLNLGHHPNATVSDGMT